MVNKELQKPRKKMKYCEVSDIAEPEVETGLLELKLNHKMVGLITDIVPIAIEHYKLHYNPNDPHDKEYLDDLRELNEELGIIKSVFLKKKK